MPAFGLHPSAVAPRGGEVHHYPENVLRVPRPPGVEAVVWKKLLGNRLTKLVGRGVPYPARDGSARPSPLNVPTPIASPSALSAGAAAQRVRRGRTLVRPLSTSCEAVPSDEAPCTAIGEAFSRNTSPGSPLSANGGGSQIFGRSCTPDGRVSSSSASPRSPMASGGKGSPVSGRLSAAAREASSRSTSPRNRSVQADASKTDRPELGFGSRTRRILRLENRSPSIQVDFCSTEDLMRLMSDNIPPLAKAKKSSRPNGRSSESGSQQFQNEGVRSTYQSAVNTSVSESELGLRATGDLHRMSRQDSPKEVPECEEHEMLPFAPEQKEGCEHGPDLIAGGRRWLAAGPPAGESASGEPNDGRQFQRPNRPQTARPAGALRVPDTKKYARATIATFASGGTADRDEVPDDTAHGIIRQLRAEHDSPEPPFERELSPSEGASSQSDGGREHEQRVEQEQEVEQTVRRRSPVKRRSKRPQTLMEAGLVTLKSSRPEDLWEILMSKKAEEKRPARRRSRKMTAKKWSLKSNRTAFDENALYDPDADLADAEKRSGSKGKSKRRSTKRNSISDLNEPWHRGVTPTSEAGSESRSTKRSSIGENATSRRGRTLTSGAGSAAGSRRSVSAHRKATHFKAKGEVTSVGADDWRHTEPANTEMDSAPLLSDFAPTTAAGSAAWQRRLANAQRRASELKAKKEAEAAAAAAAAAAAEVAHCIEPATTEMGDTTVVQAEAKYSQNDPDAELSSVDRERRQSLLPSWLQPAALEPPGKVDTEEPDQIGQAERDGGVEARSSPSKELAWNRKLSPGLSSRGGSVLTDTSFADTSEDDSSELALGQYSSEAERHPWENLGWSRRLSGKTREVGSHRPSEDGDATIDRRRRGRHHKRYDAYLSVLHLVSMIRETEDNAEDEPKDPRQIASKPWRTRADALRAWWTSHRTAAHSARDRREEGIGHFEAHTSTARCTSPAAALPALPPRRLDRGFLVGHYASHAKDGPQRAPRSTANRNVSDGRFAPEADCDREVAAVNEDARRAVVDDANVSVPKKTMGPNLGRGDAPVIPSGGRSLHPHGAKAGDFSKPQRRGMAGKVVRQRSNPGGFRATSPVADDIAYDAAQSPDVPPMLHAPDLPPLLQATKAALSVKKSLFGTTLPMTQLELAALRAAAGTRVGSKTPEASDGTFMRRATSPAPEENLPLRAALHKHHARGLEAARRSDHRRLTRRENSVLFDDGEEDSSSWNIEDSLDRYKEASLESTPPNPHWFRQKCPSPVGSGDSSIVMEDDPRLEKILDEQSQLAHRVHAVTSSESVPLRQASGERSMGDAEVGFARQEPPSFGDFGHAFLDRVDLVVDVEETEEEFRLAKVAENERLRHLPGDDGAANCKGTHSTVETPLASGASTGRSLRANTQDVDFCSQGSGQLSGRLSAESIPEEDYENISIEQVLFPLRKKGKKKATTKKKAGASVSTASHIRSTKIQPRRTSRRGSEIPQIAEGEQNPEARRLSRRGSEITQVAAAEQTPGARRLSRRGSEIPQAAEGEQNPGSRRTSRRGSELAQVAAGEQNLEARRLSRRGSEIAQVATGEQNPGARRTSRRGSGIAQVATGEQNFEGETTPRSQKA